jgi:hypothetical protein
MSKIAFQVYVNKSQLVALTYPRGGGSSIVEDRWKLSSLNLKCENPTPQHEVPNNSISGSQKTSLELEVRYQDAQIKLTPINRQGNQIHSFAILYDYNDLNIRNIGNSDDKRTIRVSRDNPDIDRTNTWP